MIIDLKNLNSIGKTESNFFYEYISEEDLCDIPSVNICLPVKVSGTVILTGKHSASIDGEVCLVLKGDCTRCLKETEKTLVLNFEEFVSQDNTDGYKVVNDKVDLSKIVDDLIIMNMPVSFLCKEDCKGICAGCGVDLNVDVCKCNK